MCPSDSLPDNVVLISGPGSEIDIDRPVTEVTMTIVFYSILPVYKSVRCSVIGVKYIINI